MANLSDSMRESDPRSPLRVGVVGLGFGAQVHVPALRQQANVEVVALLGTDQKKSRTLADELSIPHAAFDLQEMLSYDLDGVTLALPPAQVASVSRQFLAAAVPLLCEKPLGIFQEEAEALVTEAGSLPCAIDFQFAELDAFKKLASELKSRALGPVVRADVLWQTQSWAQKHEAWSWKTDAAQGGGVLSLNGSHILYLAEWLFGASKSICGELSAERTKRFTPQGHRAAEDSAELLLVHDNEVNCRVVLSNATPGANVHRWTIECQDGCYVLENLGADYMSGFSLVAASARGKTILHTPPAPGQSDGRIVATAQLMGRWVAALRGEAQFFPTFADGLRVQRLIDSILAQKSAPPLPIQRG